MRLRMKGSYYIAMILVMFAYGGSNILIKIALNSGMDQFVFVVYRHLIAMLLLAPFAYVLERKQRPSLTISIVANIFVVSSLGTTVHLNVYYAGLAYTSPTVAGALSNVIPSLTFVLALLFRMERVNITSWRGRAKVAGTVICVVGSLVFTFVVIDHHHHRPHYQSHNWVKGSALFLTSFVAWSVWLILQALVFKVYPAGLSLNAMICFFASVQSSFLALAFGTSLSCWRLRWDVQLLTIVYCGVVISGGAYYLQTRCIAEKGPLFVAVFSPLLLVVVGIASSIVFAERLHLGSFVGAFVIIVGMYCLLWGKHNEPKAEAQAQAQTQTQTQTHV